MAVVCQLDVGNPFINEYVPSPQIEKHKRLFEGIVVV